jgi:large subunit ribosomal protein L15
LDLKAVRCRCFVGSPDGDLVLKVEALGAFKDGDTVNRETLASAGLIPARPKGKVVPIKILAGGTISKKLTVAVDKVSSGAAEKIKAAGGTITSADE